MNHPLQPDSWCARATKISRMCTSLLRALCPVAGTLSYNRSSSCSGTVHMHMVTATAVMQSPSEDSMLAQVASRVSIDASDLEGMLRKRDAWKYRPTKVLVRGPGRA